MKLAGMLVEVPAMARTATSTAASLRAQVVIGAMFGLQRSISLVEPHTCNGDDSAGGAAANQIGDAYVGMSIYRGCQQRDGERGGHNYSTAAWLVQGGLKCDGPLSHGLPAK